MNWHRTWWKTTYVHVDANTVWHPDIYYWVVACSGDWCSEVDSENPAKPVEERPNAPANVRFAIEGVSIRVVWEAAEGADSYNVYYDRRLLTTAVVGTDFVHTEPEYGDYVYGVTACNSGGCSDVDVENPAKPFEDRQAYPPTRVRWLRVHRYVSVGTQSKVRVTTRFTMTTRAPTHRKVAI